MPSITPAALTFTGGTLRTNRVVPARLRYTGGTVRVASDTPITTAAEIPKLDRLFRAIDKADGETDKQFQRRQLIWQQTMEAIEGAFRAVNARVDEVAIFARLSAVEAKADAANDNAVAAQQAAAVTSDAVQETFNEIDPTYAKYYDDFVTRESQAQL